MKNLLKAIILCAAGLLISVYAFSYDYSPGAKAFVPKVIWSQTAYGGEWFTEIMIHDINGGAVVRLWFDYGPFQTRGGGVGFTIWDNTGGGPGVFKSTNILKDLQDHFDPGFNYYNRVGGLYILTQQDGLHHIHVSAKSYHSNNYSETYNAFPTSGDPRDGYSAEVGRPMKLMNMVQGSNLRSNVVVYSPGYGETVTAQFKVIGYRFLENCGLIPWPPPPPSGHNAIQYGNTFTKTFSSIDYQVFNPFTEAGCETTGNCVKPLPGTRSYQYWCYVEITPISGTGSIIVLGATAYNDTNDPAATIPVQIN